MDSLKGQIVAVTGASSGIGAACCALLKKRGATVIGLDINQPTKNDVDHFISYDQGDPDNIDLAVQQLPEGLTALLNVAVDTPIVGDFLSSFGKEAADAAWINGVILPVDGGAIEAGTVAKLGI